MPPESCVGQGPGAAEGSRPDVDLDRDQHTCSAENEKTEFCRKRACFTGYAIARGGRCILRASIGAVTRYSFNTLRSIMSDDSARMASRALFVAFFPGLGFGHPSSLRPQVSTFPLSSSSVSSNAPWTRHSRASCRCARTSLFQLSRPDRSLRRSTIRPPTSGRRAQARARRHPRDSICAVQ